MGLQEALAIGNEQTGEVGHAFQIIRTFINCKEQKELVKHSSDMTLCKCPRCNTVVNQVSRPEYCSRCGQHIEWNYYLSDRNEMIKERERLREKRNIVKKYEEVCV